MPSINIYERDLTSPYSVDTTPNIVYIPGYANIGPIDTPVLCNTLSEFYSIFGSKPYKFKKAQGYPEVKEGSSPNEKTYKFSTAAVSASSLCQVGDSEGSFIIAAELLSKNLPILFERVTSGKVARASYKDSNWGTFTAKDIYSGRVGTLISVMIKSVNTDEKHYQLTIKLAASNELGVSEKVESFDFVLDETKANSSKIYYKYIASDIIDIEWKVESTPSGFESVKTLSLPSDVNYETTDEFKVTDIYKAFMNSCEVENSKLYNLMDKGEYQIKFLTLGAYPSFEFGLDKTGTGSIETYNVFDNLIETAAKRGDCIALVDHTNNSTRTLQTTAGSVYSSLSAYVKNSLTITRKGGDSEDGYTYGAMFTPYATYRLSTQNNAQYILPASFGYLSAFAASTQTNPNWYAVAGVSRGVPSGLIGLSQNITNAIADLYQPRNNVAINCITNIKPYGYTIWGNRTLKNNSADGDLKALSFLNIRVLTCDLKKTLYQACKRYTFENNTDIMWLNFKSQIEPALAKMLSGNGIASYQIIKVATTKKATIEAIIRLVPIEPVEDWFITIELTDGVEANIQ
jgi:hypothetical protein|nr:MAG TPA: tail sheath protein [Caudoviricetes sp.]